MRPCLAGARGDLRRWSRRCEAHVDLRGEGGVRRGAQPGRVGVALASDHHGLQESPVGVACERLAGRDGRVHVGGGLVELLPSLLSTLFTRLVPDVHDQVVVAVLEDPHLPLGGLVLLARVGEVSERHGHLVEGGDRLLGDERVDVELAFELDHAPHRELEADQEQERSDEDVEDGREGVHDAKLVHEKNLQVAAQK